MRLALLAQTQCRGVEALRSKLCSLTIPYLKELDKADAD
jgi:hypothetical protein